MMNRARASFLTALFVASICTARTQTAPRQSSSEGLPDGAGKPIVQKACVSCHDAGLITSRRKTEDDWAKTVGEMVNRGAELDDDQVDIVVHYLAVNFPAPKASSAQSATTTPLNDSVSTNKLERK